MNYNPWDDKDRPGNTCKGTIHIKGLMLNDDMHAESVGNGGTYYSYYSSFYSMGKLKEWNNVKPELVEFGKWDTFLPQIDRHFEKFHYGSTINFA